MRMYQVIIVEDDPMVAEIDKQYVEQDVYKRQLKSIVLSNHLLTEGGSL